MSETETRTLPESAAPTATPAADPLTPPVSSEVLGNLRQVGEAGRRQWEQVFALAGGVQLGRLRDEAAASLQRLRREGPFVRAQLRGIELVLSLLGRVRQGAAALEESLRRSQAPAAEGTAPAA